MWPEFTLGLEKRVHLDRRTFLSIATVSTSAAARGSDIRPVDAASSGAGPSRFDQAAIRNDFAIVKTEQIFLNTAYSAPIPRQVVTAGIEALHRKAVDPLADPETDAVRTGFAKLINASTDEIGLLHSTGEAENIIARGLDLRAGDNVVISSLHYDNEFLLYPTLQKELGIEFRIAPHRNGAVEARDVEPFVDSRTRLVSVALVSHQNGYVHNLRELAELAHAHGAYLYADAIQAVGSIAVDVRATQVDFLCAGAYKWLLSCNGVAPFYVKRALFDRLRLDRYGEGQIADRLPDHQYNLYKDARRFDFATASTGPTAELAAAMRYINQIGISEIEAHGVRQGLKLQHQLTQMGHHLFTPIGNRCPIVAFYIKKPIPEARALFSKNKMNVTVRNGTVRVSPALFNTDSDVDRFLEVARDLL
jgi:selenocysteine lyase/cysteine desulfurase